jgi:predicted nucleic acid-binding Zn ribbon protein
MRVRSGIPPVRLMTRFSRWDDRGPRSLGSSLDALSNNLGLGASKSLGLLFAHWEEIVGSAMAHHVQPIRIDDRALVVSVDHPAWATQVHHLGDDLLDRVTEVTGATRAIRLEVRVKR